MRSINSSFPSHMLLPMAGVAIAAAGLYVLSVNPSYEAIGMACTIGGGVIVLFSFLLNYRAKEQKISKASELSLSSPRKPYPRWLHSTWCGSLNFLVDPIAYSHYMSLSSKQRSKIYSEAMKGPDRKRFHGPMVTCRSPYLLHPYQESFLQPLYEKVNERRWHEKRGGSWTCRKVINTFPAYQLKGQYRAQYQTSHPAFYAASKWDLEERQIQIHYHSSQTLYVPNRELLEWAAVQYRQSHHISLFVIPMSELEDRLAQERNNRSPSAPPYFGYLVMKGEGEPAIPLLFYLTDTKTLQCLVMVSYGIDRKIDQEISELLDSGEPLIYSKYRNHNDSMQTVGSFHLLTQALIDLYSSKSGGQFKSLKYHLQLKREDEFYEIRLPSKWTFGQELVNIDHDPDVIVAPGLSRRAFIKKYRMSVTGSITLTYEPKNQGIMPGWFTDFEKRILIDIPPDVNISIREHGDPSKNITLQVTIPFIQKINTFSYRYAKALCLAYRDHKD